MAHKYGFAVLDRGEIERRFMYKSLYSDNAFIQEDMHLPMPAQTIIATCLLNMFTCLSSDPQKLGVRPYAQHVEDGSGSQPLLFSAPSP